MRFFSCPLLVAVTLLRWTATAGSTVPITRCNPASHICEGRCPALPSEAALPPGWGEEGGLCLKDSETGVCVCWLPPSSPEQHMQTLFKCEVLTNNDTVKHVMCLPPSHCYPPSLNLGCMIVLQCPCTTVGRRSSKSRWQPVVAVIFRSKTPVPEEGSASENSKGTGNDVREFSVKHLLFLLAFVVAPLLCWCLLTFFHEGKCRRKRRRTPESEPMPTERVQEVVTPQEAPATGTCTQSPTAPKFESPPPYREAFEPGESCPLAVDCGPPPSYEDAMREQAWRVNQRIQEI